MKKNIALLCLMAAIIYGAAAYTRPHEPAGVLLHETLEELPAVELPRVPFSGLLKLDEVEEDFSPRPTLSPLEVVPSSSTPYTPRELSELYPSH